MNKNKVYIEGYEVGFSVETTGAREKKIQVASGEIVSIYERFIYKSIECEKVKVPQCVADWIKYCKRTGVNLYNALDMGDLYFYNYANQKDDLKLKEFFETDTNQEIFARAWLDGYEVEKEKRYFVKAKSIGDHNNYLKYNTNQKHWYFGSRFIYVNDVDTKIHHTRKELEEANFGWVFDCEGIEIEEVE